MTAPAGFSVLDRVEAARALYPGNIKAALTYVDRNAIEDVMWLLERSRVQARYDHTRFPRLPALFERERKGAGDMVWEGQHSWANPAVADGTLVDQCDTPAAYLNALTCHLPIGNLQETGPQDGLDRRRSGVYLVTLGTTAAWEAANPGLPAPWGNRKKRGDVWITRPTLQLLLDVQKDSQLTLEWDGKILDSWTAPSSEALLKPLRGWLADARMEAIYAGDKFAEEAIKILYYKLVSTMGDSRANFEMRRMDWRHIIRSQAFSNLWRRAYKAHDAGFTVAAVKATDELHIIHGDDWRSVWTEGRGLAHLSLKRTYPWGQED